MQPRQALKSTFLGIFIIKRSTKGTIFSDLNMKKAIFPPQITICLRRGNTHIHLQWQKFAGTNDRS